MPLQNVENEHTKKFIQVLNEQAAGASSTLKAELRKPVEAGNPFAEQRILLGSIYKKLHGIYFSEAGVLDQKNQEELRMNSDVITEEIGTLNSLMLLYDDDPALSTEITELIANFQYIQEQLITPVLKKEEAAVEPEFDGNEEKEYWDKTYQPLINQVYELRRDFSEKLVNALANDTLPDELPEIIKRYHLLQSQLPQVQVYVLVINNEKRKLERNSQLTAAQDVLHSIRKDITEFNQTQVAEKSKNIQADDASAEEWELNHDLHPKDAKNLQNKLVDAREFIATTTAAPTLVDAEERAKKAQELKAEVVKAEKNVLLLIEAYQKAPEQRPLVKLENEKKADYLNYYYIENLDDAEHLGSAHVKQALDALMQEAWSVKARDRFKVLEAEKGKIVYIAPTRFGEVEPAQRQIADSIVQLENLINQAMAETNSAIPAGPERQFILNNYFKEFDQEIAARRDALYELWSGTTEGRLNIEAFYPAAKSIRERITYLNSHSYDANEEYDHLAHDIHVLETQLADIRFPYQTDGRYPAYIEEALLNPAKERVIKLSRERVLPPGSTELAREYFLRFPDLHGRDDWAGPYHHGEAHDGEHGVEAWQKATPEELALAIWMYAVKMQFLNIGTRNQDNFFKVTILKHGTSLHEHASYAQLISSFAALATFYEKRGNMDYKNKIEMYAGNLFNSCVEIETMMNWGSDTMAASKDLKKLAGLVAAGGTFDSTDLTRLFSIGEGFEGENFTGDRIGVAWQVLYAMCEPRVHQVALRSAGIDGPDEKLRLVRNLKEKNPLSIFPYEASKNSGEDTSKRYVKEVIIQIIAGSDEDPIWMQYRDLDERKRAAELYIGWLYYGDPNLNPQDIVNGTVKNSYKEDNPHPGSLLGRFNASEGKVGSTRYGENKTRFLTDEEDARREKGFIAQKVAINFFVASFDHARASGAGMIKGEDAKKWQAILQGKRETRIESGYLEVNVDGLWLRVHDTSKGTLGENMADRPANIAAYRAKLINETGGSDGSLGPIKSVDYFLETLPSATQAYYYVAPEERYGRTLSDELMFANKGEFNQIRFQNFVAGTDRVVRYVDTAPMGMDMYEKIIGGLGINWSSISTSVKGSEIAPIFNFRELEKVQKLSRNVYYELTRDYGTQIYTWPTDEAYWHYRIVEEYWRSTGEDFNAVTVGQTVEFRGETLPAKYRGVRIRIDENMRKTLLKCVKIPTVDHVLYDARPTKDESEQTGVGADQKNMGFTRYATTVHKAFHIAPDMPEKTPKNEFELAVMRDTTDGYMMRKKLILGLLLINDLSVSALTGIVWDDIVVIMEFLSHSFWDQRYNNQIMVGFRNLVGRPERAYNGLGIFTEQEARALLKTAGVDVGIMSRLNAYSERLGKVGRAA